MFPVKIQRPRSDRVAADWDRDSGYDGASNSTGDHSSNRIPRHRSNSRPPSSYKESGRSRSVAGSSQRDDRSDSDARSSSERSVPLSSHRSSRSNQAGRQSAYPQPGVEGPNYPPSHRGDDGYSQRDDQSAYHSSSGKGPTRLRTSRASERNDRPDGHPSYQNQDHKDQSHPPRSYTREEEPPPLGRYDTRGAAAPPTRPQDTEGISRRDREFAAAMGEGIGQMIKAVAYKPKTFGAVSLSVKPDTMTWMMKRERICALCNDFIGREQFWSKCPIS